MASKPIVVLSSRNINNNELVQFHKFLNTLVFNEHFYNEKKCSTLPYECVLLDIRHLD